MNVIIGIFWVAFSLLIWFQTEAVLEYAKLFKLSKWLKLEDWEKIKSPEFTYTQFLVTYYNSFLTRLLSCPICVSSWVGLLASSIVGISYYPIITLLGLLLYSITVKIL